MIKRAKREIACLRKRLMKIKQKRDNALIK